MPALDCAGNELLPLAHRFAEREPAANASSGVPPRGEVWPESRLLAAIGAKVGDEVSIGAASFRVGRALVDRLHATGLAHLDLNRQNLMRTASDEIVAVDLAGAVWFRPGGLAHRLLFRLFSVADETAYLKWKARLTPGSLDAAEEKRFRRLKALRALWPFNRKPPRPNPKF